jgi:dethiobiotin synthetase
MVFLDPHHAAVRARSTPMIRAAMVTGTDTGVGKTVAAASIAWALASAGYAVGVFKPAQTGVADDQPGDADFVLRALGSDQLPPSAYGYRFREPAAPLVAAQAQGESVDIARIREAYDQLRRTCDVVLVEGSGGLLVPLAEAYSMADLARELTLPLILAARPGLGTLNHTLLTLEAARARGLQVLGVVLCGWREPADLVTMTNPPLLCALGNTNLLGVLPWDEDLSVERMHPGHIREWAADAVAPTLGGRFGAAAFLTACAANLPRAGQSASQSSRPGRGVLGNSC